MTCRELAVVGVLSRAHRANHGRRLLTK